MSRTPWRLGQFFGAESFRALDDRARARIGRSRLLAFVVGEAAHAQHHQLVDLRRVERVALALRRHRRKIVEDDRRRKDERRAVRVGRRVSDQDGPRVTIAQRCRLDGGLAGRIEHR